MWSLFHNSYRRANFVQESVCHDEGEDDGGADQKVQPATDIPDTEDGDEEDGDPEHEAVPGADHDGRVAAGSCCCSSAHLSARNRIAQQFSDLKYEPELTVSC